MKLVNIAKIGTIFASLASVIAAPLSASAIPFNSNSVYKVIDSRTGQTEVYFSATAGTRIEVDMGESDRAAARLAGSCGEVRINAPSDGSNYSYIKAEGTSIDPNTLETKLLPSCSNGQFTEARPNNFKTPQGRIILVGFTPGQAVAVATPRAVVRRATVNGCGFARVRSSSSFTLPAKFTYEGSEITVANLPDAGSPPVCRSTRDNAGNRTYTGYVPSTW
jgi:hypothetical protein